MKNLTTIQKEFILEYFFKKDDCAGWKEIATELLANGRCIVAGNDKMWMGGIGNFIRTEKTKNAFGCLEYYFNLDEFVQSDWFRGFVSSKTTDISLKIADLQAQKDELAELL